MNQAEMQHDPLVAAISAMRIQIKAVARDEKAIITGLLNADFPMRNGEDHGETMENLWLAYRHLEDASMRLGKAIQSRDGGVSVYDPPSTVGA
ncbi:MAG: hypothetical protein ACRDQZ_13190 [Mycobacteriales bacterium]